jgi:hypothetical protein
MQSYTEWGCGHISHAGPASCPVCEAINQQRSREIADTLGWMEAMMRQRDEALADAERWRKEAELRQARVNDQQRDLDNVYAERDKLHDAIARHKREWAECKQPPNIYDARLWEVVGLWPKPEIATDF